jgi:hypothetical protein
MYIGDYTRACMYACSYSAAYQKSIPTYACVCIHMFASMHICIFHTFGIRHPMLETEIDIIGSYTYTFMLRCQNKQKYKYCTYAKQFKIAFLYKNSRIHVYTRMQDCMYTKECQIACIHLSGLLWASLCMHMCVYACMYAYISVHSTWIRHMRAYNDTCTYDLTAHTWICPEFTTYT